MEIINILDLIENNKFDKLITIFNNDIEDNNNFIIELDNIWRWLGFQQKTNAKRLLEKNFIINKDYKIIKNEYIDKKEKSQGGHNREIILLNTKTFKLFCLKIKTNKTNEILEFIVKLEEMIKIKLINLNSEEKEIEKKNLLEEKEIEKQKEIEKIIIKQFPINTECIYIGKIDNSNEAGEKLIKFGQTNDLSNRLINHRKDFNNFLLIEAFRVQNKVEIENLIKTHKIIKKQIRTVKIDGKNKNEIIAYNDDNFTIKKLSYYIKEIINLKIYNIDNYNKLLKKYDDVEEEFRIINDELKELKEKFNEQKKIIKEQNIEIIYLKEKLEEKEKIIDKVDKEHESVYKNVLLPEDELNKKFDEFIKEICIVRPDVEEKSVNIEGRYRLWSQVKPKKEVFHALKNYLDIRFKPKKINGIHSYNGIRLKEVEYKKRDEESDVQRFIFHACQFSDTGKILNSTLLKEYQKWKLSLTKETSDNDIKELKDYLNTSPYALKATVWVDNESNEGYYGIGLKTIGYQPKYASTTGKKVYKVECKSNLLLSTFDSILNASLQQDISRVAMSRAVKNKTVFNNDYYYTSDISVINNNIE